jgi:hypothetical protein
MLVLEDSHLRIPGSIQKYHAGDSSSGPQTFALDRSGTLRTGKTLRAYLNNRSDKGDAQSLFVSQKGALSRGKPSTTS